MELEAENLTHVRDLQPHGQTWHSSAGWLFPSWLFIDGIFLVREAQLAPPALHVQEDKEMKLGEGAHLFCSLLPPHVEAVPAQPRAALSRCLAAALALEMETTLVVPTPGGRWNTSNTCCGCGRE